MTSKEFNDLWKSLNEEQKERVRAKARWEHMGLWAVLNEWKDIWKDEQSGIF